MEVKAVKHHAKGLLCLLAWLGCAEPTSGGDATPGGEGAGATGGAANGGEPAGVAAGEAAGGRAPGDGAGAAAGLSPSSWEALTAPLTGDHRVESADEVVDCGGELIAQEYRVVPNGGCYWSETPGLERTVRECVIDPTCTGPGGLPRAALRGVPRLRLRVVLVPDPGRRALRDRCRLHVPARRSCYVSGEVGVTYCYPDGQCEPAAPSCTYPQELCQSDADCGTAPGGTCAKRIHYARCAYHGCRVDTDCPVGERCACAPFTGRNECVPADCQADADCGAGQACRLEYECYDWLVGYRCSTSADTCQSDHDCDLACVAESGADLESCDWIGRHCARVTDHWECVELDCPLID